MFLKPVVIYFSKADCPYCEKLAALLAAHEIPSVKLTLDGDKSYDFTREQFNAIFEVGSTFPQVCINGNRVGGFTDFVKLMEAEGIVPRM